MMATTLQKLGLQQLQQSSPLKQVVFVAGIFGTLKNAHIIIFAKEHSSRVVPETNVPRPILCRSSADPPHLAERKT